MATRGWENVKKSDLAGKIAGDSDCKSGSTNSIFTGSKLSNIEKSCEEHGLTGDRGIVRCLTLPWPPQANTMWRKMGKNIVLSPEARAFKARVAAMFDGSGIVPTTAPKIAVWLYFYRPTKIGDVDNRIKPTLDALNGSLWRDDRQVSEVHAYNLDDKANPRVEMIVVELEEAAPTIDFGPDVSEAAQRPKRARQRNQAANTAKSEGSYKTSG